jgi:O-Antigen ligase
MIIKTNTLFNLFIISATFGVGISYSKLYLFHIFAVLLLLAHLYLNNFKIKYLSESKSKHQFFLFMFIWYLFTILWALNKTLSFTYLFYIVCGLIIIYSMTYYVSNINKQYQIFNVIKYIIILEIIFSLLEIFTSFRLPISPFSPLVSYFGREMTISNNLSSDVLAIMYSNPTGFRWNPNELAATMIIVLPFFLFSNKIVIKYIGIASISMIIVSTGSRVSMIALVLELIIWSLLFSIKRTFLLLGFCLMMIIIGSTVTENIKNSNVSQLIDFANLFNVVKIFFSEDHSESKNSIGVRQQLIFNGLKSIKDSNGMGVGAGNSIVIQEKYGFKSGAKTTSMHNFWLEIFVDAGVLFGVLFLTWYFYITRKLYLISKKTEIPILKYFSSSMFISMSGFFVAAQSASSAIYMLSMWLMYGFACVTVNNYYKHQKVTYVESQYSLK